MFNRIHNPDYYYRRDKHEEKKAEKKTKNRKYKKKPYPVFKVQD